MENRTRGGGGGQHEIGERAFVVHALEGIDNGAAFERDQAGEVADEGVAGDAANGHGQVQLDDVARAPAALDDGEAGLEGGLHAATVDLDRPGFGGGVVVGVEIARQRRAARPAGDAQAQGETAGLGGCDGDAHGAVPRVGGFLRELHLATRDLGAGLARGVEVDEQILVAHGVGVAAERGEQAQDVGRAAGAAEPGGAAGVAVVVGGLAVVFERVGVEETVAGEGDAAEEAVV